MDVSKASLIGSFYLKDSDIFSDEAQFETTMKGKPMLVDKAGYRYRKAQHTSVDSSKITWTCQQTRTLKCPARAITVGSYITSHYGTRPSAGHEHSNKHNHPPPETEVEVQDEAKFLKSTRDRPMLLDKAGYCYYKGKASTIHLSRITWACQRHREFKCPARCTTDGFHIVKYLHKHDHSPPENIIEI